LLPDPTAEEYAALKESIRVFGVKEAVVVDENGEVLEGRQRLKICGELKITDFPVRIEAGLTEEQKRHLVLSLNVNRRALTTAQKREIVKRELQRTPDISNRWLAEICGVDHKTVAEVRRELEAGGELPHLTALRGKDGKTQRATKVRNTAVLVPSSRMTKRALSATRSLGDEAPRRTLALNRAERLAAIKNHRDKEKRPLLTALPKDEADQYRLIHCDFRTLGKKAGLKPGTVDMIFADPPYCEKDLPVFDDLGRFGKKYLKDGGIMAVYSPVLFLPQVYQMLTKHLTYHWQCGFLFDKAARKPYYGRRITHCYRPVIIMSKGDFKAEFSLKDMLDTTTREKELHPWQQGLDGVLYYIKELSNPGDLIVEPFGGAFTGAAACKTLGNRRYIGCDIEEKWVKVGIDRLARMSQEKEEDEDWGDAAQTDDEDWGVGVTDKDGDWAA
jgi:ParB-like chromosome segregation protein Spo0J